MSALERWMSGALVLAGLLVLAALGVRCYGAAQYLRLRSAVLTRIGEVPG